MLVQLQDGSDPETGQRYTVKRYRGEKTMSGESTWRHVKVTLAPLNPECQPIELVGDDEGTIAVVAELWREFSVRDPAGSFGIHGIVITPSGQYYAYHQSRVLSTLYLADHLE